MGENNQAAENYFCLQFFYALFVNNTEGEMELHTTSLYSYLCLELGCAVLS